MRWLAVVSQPFLRRRYIGLASVLLATTVSAQGAFTVASIPAQIKDSQSTPTTAKPVTLTVGDSTLGYVLQEIGRQARLQVIYFKSSPQFAKRINIRIARADAKTAFAAALKGTNLIAAFAPDGESVIIRPAEQTPGDSITTGSITGRVVDSSTKQSIGSATVAVVGTRLSTVTGENGTFRIPNVPSGEQMLSVRRLGYITKTIPVKVNNGTTTTTAIVLQPSSKTLSEVVTTATGPQRRLEIANDVAKIQVDSLMRNAPVRSVTDILAVARVPGVIVTPSSGLPGAPSRIRIRGIGNIDGNNDPVVFVDGIRISAPTSTRDVMNQAVRFADAAESGTARLSRNQFVPSRLDDIDPASIETIEILKGPSAAALYGMDAANGVILITTRKGQPGVTRWTVNISHSVDVMPGQYQPVYTGYGVSPNGGVPVQGTACDLRDVMNLNCLRDSFSTFNPRNSSFSSDVAPRGSTLYRANVGGGGQTVRYYFGGSYEDRSGATKTPEVDLVRMRLLGEPVPSSLSRPERHSSSTLTATLTATPRQNLALSFSFNGARSRTNSAGLELLRLSGGNALPFEDTLAILNGANIHTESLNSETVDTRLGMSARWQPRSWLPIQLTGGLQHIATNDERTELFNICGAGTGCPLPTASIGIASVGRSVSTLSVNVPISVSLGRFERFLSLRPSFGGNFWKDVKKVQRGLADSLPPGSLVVKNALQQALESSESAIARGGAFLDVTVGLFQRLYPSFGIRRDLGSALKSAISYPSLGTSWLVSDEPFFPKTDFMSSLRLRVKLGQSGVEPRVASVSGSYNTAPAIIGGQLVNSIEYQTIGNANLKPTLSKEWEYGFDADLFRERTSITTTLSNKWNRNQLLDHPLAPSIGFKGAYTENIARVYNRSVEVSANHRVFQREGLMWDIGIGFSSILNRVQELGDVLPFGAQATRIVEGYPIEGIWLRPVLLYADVNHDGLLTENEVIFGDTTVYTGWNTPSHTLTYHTTLGMLNNRLTIAATVNYDGPQTQRQIVYDGWGAVDPDAPISEKAKCWLIGGVQGCTPGGGLFVSNTGNAQTITALRVSSMSVRMTLPATWARRISARQASVALQGSNLGLWSRYRGRDPGVNSTPIGEKLQDNGVTLPQPRRFVLNVDLQF